MLEAVVVVLLIAVVLLIIAMVNVFNEFEKLQSKCHKRHIHLSNVQGFSSENKKRIDRIWKRLRKLEGRDDQ